ncbi:MULTISPECIES: zinc-dependent alcohol dehydrogenase family protein [unclassified Bacillus (in: firmicutes)]|uniref:zinc-dependent alcohol dehydrogenase family protein n=1 Tax=unclassified Bacillus (in: firmicutes) TaxID=185979 RepID=UPI001BED0375|nr:MULTISPECIES: zinc-dependent alcohol dehydrogenase family protein [unclassified Bacillus (in: firmicutes)]MBT2617380.1 zinc-dependent alcohol dehydrogenase family protein [Bacillus sp. ISL-78]MBT2630928.1 zinc-dependent alcohol dehydrogenase family protein [Bacillus sp. ISL-101]
MKAQIIQSFGDPSVFQLEEVSKPELKPGHVLIQVKASSVNPIDTKVRAGAVPAVAPEFPAVLHGDVAGLVSAVGEGVTEFKVGDEVFGCAGGFKGTGGALAEFMLADADLLAHKPKKLTMEEAASLPLVAITAWEALFNRAHLVPSQDILIHAATGGVGHIAIQLAKWKGATVYTTASSREKLEIGTRLGADVAINYREENVHDYVQKYTDGKGFDVVFDTVGGENLDRSFEAAAVHGTVAAIAARSTHDLSPVHSKGLSLHVTFMLLKILNKDMHKQYGEILKKVAKVVEEGKLHPLVDPNMFTFDEVSKAHEYMESGKAIGKIVLKNDW